MAITNKASKNSCVWFNQKSCPLRYCVGCSASSRVVATYQLQVASISWRCWASACWDTRSSIWWCIWGKWDRFCGLLFSWKTLMRNEYFFILATFKLGQILRAVYTSMGRLINTQFLSAFILSTLFLFFPEIPSQTRLVAQKN